MMGQRSPPAISASSALSSSPFSSLVSPPVSIRVQHGRLLFGVSGNEGYWILCNSGAVEDIESE